VLRRRKTWLGSERIVYSYSIEGSGKDTMEGCASVGVWRLIDKVGGERLFDGGGVNGISRWNLEVRYNAMLKG
jgi:hypothetical protein